ncbi:MAG TPA: hypothetical protein VN278_01060 [Methanosarcina sp.]|nr:hypothetical protein [Methanosarcina sp.]
MRAEFEISEDSQEKINSIRKKLEDIRKKMEIEALNFIEATKKFTNEWILREMEVNIPSSEMKLPYRISDIVETQVNRDELWVHRSELSHAGISRDYTGFKKEKIRKELTSNIRLVLGSAAEILGELNDGKSENKIWVNEGGRKKYGCFLRFSDEMEASLNSYLEMLEELFTLEHEIQEEIKMPDEKGE